MKVFMVTAAAFALVGCTTVDSVQSECESRHADFQGMASCMKSAIAENSMLRTNPNVKLYLLKADQLAAMVTRREVDEPTARFALQEMFVRMKRQQAAELDQVLESLNKPTVRTNCTTYGNTTSCTTR